MRSAVYVRVSTKRQAQAQTIEQQLERLQAVIASRGGHLGPDQIFRDEGYSGATLNRPGLDRLREQVAAAEIDQVLITSPDRLARNYVHQVLLIEECERAGCRVEFLDRPMSQDPHDQLVLQIRGAVAEYERALIADRMRRGRQAKLRAGSLLPWTRVPFGYRVDPDRPRDPAGVRVEPAEAAIVAELFATYLEAGQSVCGLAKQLTALQTPTATGATRWNPSTIRGLLHNPVYTGVVYAGRTRARTPQQRRSPLQPIGQPGSSRSLTPPEDWVAVAHIPAIITPEQFDAVQAKLAQNQQFASRNNTAHPYLLRALVSCGVCQSSCIARTSNDNAYYVCRGKAHPTLACRDTLCPARYAPAAQLDTLVWEDLCAMLTHPEEIAQALQRAHAGEWLPQELLARREQLRAAQVSLEQQVERLTEAYLGAVIPLEEYRRRRQELDRRHQTLEQQARQLAASIDRQAEVGRVVTSIEAFCQRVQAGLARATFEQKRHLVELLIDRVVVTNEEVEIRYVIPTNPSSEQTRFCHLRADYFGREAVALVAGGGSSSGHRGGSFRLATIRARPPWPGRCPMAPGSVSHGLPCLPQLP